MLTEISFQRFLYWRSGAARSIIWGSISWISKAPSEEFLIFSLYEVRPGAQQVEERVPGTVAAH